MPVATVAVVGGGTGLGRAGPVPPFLPAAGGRATVACSSSIAVGGRSSRVSACRWNASAHSPARSSDPCRSLNRRWQWLQ